MRKVQSRAYFLVAFVAIFAAAMNWAPTVGGTTGRPNESFAEIPMEVGEWGGERGSFDENTQNVLPTCALFLAEYVNKKGDLVQVSIVYGRDLGDFHQPEYCLEGQGWRTTQKRSLQIRESDGFTHPAEELRQRTSYEDQVVLFWFATEGKAVTTLGKHKIRVYVDRLISRQVKPSALVRFIAPVRTDESSASAATLELARQVGPYIREVLGK